MSGRRAAWILSAIAFVTAIVVAVPGSAGPVHADDDDIEVTIVTPGGLPGTVTYTNAGVLIPGGSTQPASGCAGIAGNAFLCMGTPIDQQDAPVIVSGGLGNPFIPNTQRARTALGWMVDEAIEAIRIMYGVPLDARIRTYAAADIRAYVLNRILDIIDKVAYDQPLTANERLTFEFVEDTVKELERTVARAAYEEFKAWEANKCGYVPPAAPSFVTQPVTMPAVVTAWCAHKKPQFEAAFIVSPPYPTPEHFLAWGAYRNAHVLGIAHLSEPQAQQALVATVQASVGGAGIAAAIGAAKLAGLAVGASSTLASAVAGAMGSFSVAAVSNATAAAIATTATIAATSVVAIVVIAVMIAAVAIWQLVEMEKVGATLAARVNAAYSDDPFGLESLKPLLRDLELRENLDPANPPGYRREENVTRLNHLVTAWLTTTPTGQHIPDVVGVWDDNSTTARDFRFRVDGAPEVVDSITVPSPDGPVQVRFNRSWLILTPQGGTPRAALWFRFTDADGRTALASRSPDGGWVITHVTDTARESIETDVLRYRDGGVEVEVEIVPPASPLAGPRPTVVGSFVPGRVLYLSPNPIAEDGGYDPDRFRDDYSYAWQVDRFDSATGTWVPVTGATTYAAQFTPAQAGDYRAVVTMHDLVEPAPDRTGIVTFRVSAPVIEPDVLELQDTGELWLRVLPRIRENAPDDTVTVTVRWPGDFGSDDVVETTVELECETTPDPTACITPAPDLLSGDVQDALTYEITAKSDLSQGVRVTVTNSFGGVLIRDFAIDHPGRPGFALAPPPDPGQLGAVQLDAGMRTIDVQVVAGDTGDANYDLAIIEPGADASFPLFRLVDPATNVVSIQHQLLGKTNLQLAVVQDLEPEVRWRLVLRAQELDFGDLGVYELPFVLRQQSGEDFTRTPFLLRLQVVASPGDRFRGALGTELGTGPDQYLTTTVPGFVPLVLAGRTDWGEPDAELCVSIERSAVGEEVTCAPIDDYYEADGTPKPFPYEQLLPEGLEVSAYAARAWLNPADAGDPHVYPGVHEIRFLLLSGRPEITTLAWDAATGSATLAVEPFSETSPITGVTCVLDDEPVACWGPGGGTWTPAVDDGDHTLRVRVAAADDNYTTGLLEFTVGSPTPGGGDDENHGGSGGAGGSGGPGGSGGSGGSGSGASGGAPEGVDEPGTDGEPEPAPTATPAPAATPGQPGPDAGGQDAGGEGTGGGIPPLLVGVLIALVLAGGTGGLILLLIRRRVAS